MMNIEYVNVLIVLLFGYFRGNMRILMTIITIINTFGMKGRKYIYFPVYFRNTNLILTT